MSISFGKGVGRVAFDKVAYDNDFKRQNYDEIRALVPKGKREEIKTFAKEKGVSVSRLVVEALEAHCGLNLSK